MGGHPKSKTPAGERDIYGTQPETFNRIQEVAGIQFVHDVCAQRWSSKCDTYWTKRDNALKIKWTDYFDPLTPLWMNPPYSVPNLPIWTEKAALEASDGLIVMGLIPDSRSSGWYQDNLDGVASTAFIPDGRINFLKPNGEVWRGNMWPSVFPLWTPWQTGQTSYSYFSREPVRACPVCRSTKTTELDICSQDYDGLVAQCQDCNLQAPADQWRIK